MNNITVHLGANHPGGKHTCAGIKFAAGDIQNVEVNDAQLAEIQSNRFLRIVEVRDIIKKATTPKKTVNKEEVVVEEESAFIEPVAEEKKSSKK